MTSAGRDSTMRAVAGGIPRIALELPSRLEDVAAARHAIVAFLGDHGVASVVVDDVELLMSELVTNAIIHPAPPLGRTDAVHVEVEVADAVVIAVANVGPSAAIPPVSDWAPASPFATSGRGLGIVRRLCDEVSVEQVGEHAVVRCRRRLPDGGATP